MRVSVKVQGLALLVLLMASASLTQAAAPAYDKPPAGTNCNRSCWRGNNLFGLKNTLFKLCKAKVKIIETNETKPGSGKSGAPKYNVCNTFIYYKFSSWGELNAFQTCQSKQSLYVNSVVNKNFKQILTAPPKYSRC